ncbi:MAG: choice-of-anchor D domain-containing protein, partial [Candidatus Sulfotelmatobacter sp.]
MARGFRASHAAIFLRAGNLGLIFLGLVTLVGCQGFSSTKPADQQQQSGTLVLGSASLEFGSVTAGTSKTLTTTVSNTGAASVTISSVAISNQNFSLSGPSLPVTIAVGQNSTISLVFIPNAAGAFSATVSVSSNASNVSTTLSLSGTGVANGQLALNPTSQSFGSVTVGSQSNQIVTLTNNSASTVNISQASVSGTGFKLSGVTAPIALNASQSTTFTVTFAPQSTAPASGSVTITSDAPNPTLSMPLSGTGVALAALGSSPTSLAFGSVQVGNNQALAETVSNTGGSSLTLSQVGISGTGFTLSGITTPVTLTPGQSASFSVSFTPQSASSASGSLTITSNASNP